MMTCEERRDLMLLYVTGALEPAEAAEVRGHLVGGCPACAGALAEAEATVHRIPESLAPLAVPGGAWGRIEKRIAVSGGKPGAGEPLKISERRYSVAAMVRVAAALLVIGLLLFEISNMRNSQKRAENEVVRLFQENNDLRRDAATANTLQVRVADLERQVRAMEDGNQKMMVMLDQAQQNYVGKITRLMHADQYAVAPAQDKGATGTLFWKKGDGTWTLMASNLKPLPAGRTYEMWIVTAKGEKLAAGTFDPTSSGTAMYEMKLPADVGAIQLAAVTDEPIGGVAKATGQIQFLSDVTKKQ